MPFFHKNNGYLFYLCLSGTFLSAQQPLFYWDSQQESDCLCPGSWVVHQPPESVDQPIVSWEIGKQSFNLKDSIVEGQQVAVWGQGYFIQAPFAHFHYAPPEAQHWDFYQGASLWARHVIIDAAALEYQQYDQHLSASEVRFLIPAPKFWGKCASLDVDKKHWEMRDLRLTSCPPDNGSWDLRSPLLTYDLESDVLIIEKPTLQWGEYALLTLPDMSFDGVRAQHRLENLPKLSVATQAGIGISFPMLWTRQSESIEVIPEVNLKRGLGMGVNIQKSSVLARGFLQLLPPSDTANRYWMMEVVSASKHDDFEYAYQGALISDEDFVYRYPHVLVFEEELYYMNRAWARHGLGEYGQIQFYGEKLYLSQEAREVGFEVIENTAHAQWDYHKNFLYSQWGVDNFFRYDDTSYWRWYGQQEIYWHPEQQWRFSLIEYPSENFGYGSFDVVQGTPWLDIGIGQLGILILGRSCESYGTSPLIDTTAQPLTFQSLSTLQWHQGRDWISHGLQITPRWKIDLSEDIVAEMCVSYAIDPPEQPWDAISQPYLTPFRDGDRFSPMGINIAGQMWEAQALFDGARWEWVTSEWRRHFYFGRGNASLGAYFHRYFPLDRLSSQTGEVAQLITRYSSDPQQRWGVDCETRFNLIPIKLSRTSLHLKYQHCCWNAGIKALAEQQYDSDTNGMKWQYHLSFNIELVGSGLSSDGIKERAFSLMPQEVGAESLHPFYDRMISG